MRRATRTDLLAAVAAFVDRRGSVPPNSLVYDQERRGDRRFPCWATLKKAGFTSFTDVAEAMGFASTGRWWNRTRVRDALRRFAQEHGTLPGATERYEELRARRREYPSFYHVLKLWPSFEHAARACGVRCDATHAEWTASEEEFLRAFAGTCTRQELAACLPRHTEMAIKRRLYDLHLTCTTAQGLWTRGRLGAALGCGQEVIQPMERKGVFPVTRISHFVYVDPADLPLALLPLATAELQAAMLARHRARLAETIAWGPEARSWTPPRAPKGVRFLRPEPVAVKREQLRRAGWAG